MGRIPVTALAAMLARWCADEEADWQATSFSLPEARGGAFRRDGNPLDAWDAILLARARGDTLPQWVMDYLATCAAGIHDLRVESRAGKATKPAMIARALGMVSRGPGTVFPDAHEWDWLAIGLQIYDAIEAGDKETFAIEYVAQANGIGKSKARDAWKRFQTDPFLL